MAVPQENVRFSCNAGRIRSSIPLRPTFGNNETWYCGTAIAVPYVKLHSVFDVTGYYGEETVYRRSLPSKYGFMGTYSAPAITSAMTVQGSI